MIDVTAAILIEDDCVFLARREDAHRGWEFPGGKIEPGETPETCLRRELEEEFSIAVDVGEFIGESIYAYAEGRIRLLAYTCCNRTGDPVCNVHAECRWVPVADLPGYDLLPADIPLARLIANRTW